MSRIPILFFLVLFAQIGLHAETIKICHECSVKSIQKGIDMAQDGDILEIQAGKYLEHDILIDKAISLVGIGNPQIDVETKGYGILIKSDKVKIKNLRISNIGKSFTKDFAAIYISKSKDFLIENVRLEDVFFGVLIEKSNHGIVRNNHISSSAVLEAASGNGIHAWNCDSLTIDKNELHNLRDGIYFEFVTHSKVTHNQSYDNLRYGLHFMFSNNDEYHYNTFTKNGAGVAVMFSKYIKMTHNRFHENWGSASYGLLLKEIYDAEIEDNIIEKNTVGINAEGCTRINYNNNSFISNGWAIKISGACYSNVFQRNNFLNNSFDVSYNSKMNDNSFEGNYWSSYTGYDLDKDGFGDVPFRPVKLFSYIVNRTPETILLLRSLFMEILDFSEKVSPVFTPDNLMDNKPLMKKII
ncbi:nitrous oxide reductase family maturation protein NosD [Arcticibacterium luteifluviistationis]|uniref:Nitrous oxide reductase family maturation protein NosD n=1 Tax=Arcticibacterium luteifluviistationis TaxID=1784714 RepID=A0A2Z4GFU4_9BACT|nr:nitrous oxide reductase family maturation protein NosD [Arcticibacterium luteifluviistationis]AWW00042.1 nitrous oxide reductase family maturation protein NosD [Arcticibacterium luteifluviistationis]